MSLDIPPMASMQNHRPLSRVVIDELGGIGLVEAGSQVSLSDGNADSIADTSAQRSCVSIEQDKKSALMTTYKYRYV